MRSIEILLQCTRINHTNELKAGDVIYIKEVRQMNVNRKKGRNWSECNFHRIAVVTDVECKDGKWVYGHTVHHILASATGEHRLIEELLRRHELSTNGSGANHQVDEHREIYKLDNIFNKFPVFQPVCLVGNPSYDLMM